MFRIPRKLQVVKDTCDSGYCIDYSLFAVQLGKVDILHIWREKNLLQLIL